jgi:hypothetical protein
MTGAAWAGEMNISLIIPNTSSIVDLNGPGLGTGYATTYTEDQAPIPMVNQSALTVTDADQLTVNGAVITLTNVLNAGSET